MSSSIQDKFYLVLRKYCRANDANIQCKLLRPFHYLVRKGAILHFHKLIALKCHDLL